MPPVVLNPQRGRKQAEEGSDRKFFNQYWQPFAWAAFIGFKNNRLIPISEKVDSDVFKHSVINIQAPDLLKSLIVMAIIKLDDEVEGNKEFLKDTNKIPQIIDEHLNEGFEIINRKLNKVVDSTTKTSSLTLTPTEIRCFNKGCHGKINSALGRAKGVIRWYFRECENEGVISHWQGTKWDDLEKAL